MKKYKTIIVIELIFLTISVFLFFVSFFFSISENCDYLYELHPNVMFFLRLCSILLFVTSIVGLSVLFLLRKINNNNWLLFFILVLFIPFLLSSFITAYSYDSFQYYNENGIVDATHPEFFPYASKDSVYSYTTYTLPNIKYIYAYSNSGILDEEFNYQIEYFATSSKLALKQFEHQSNNYYDMIDMEKFSETSGNNRGVQYKIIKSQSGIKVVIINKENVFFCSLYGNKYNEDIYETNTFVNYALELYEHSLINNS